MSFRLSWYQEDTHLEASVLSYKCDTLVSSDDVVALTFDSRGILVCGATVSDGRRTSPLLPDVKPGCDAGGCGTVYNILYQYTSHT